MWVSVGRRVGRVLIHAIFILLRKIKTANFTFFFSELQVALIFIASETRDCSAKIEQMKRNM